MKKTIAIFCLCLTLSISLVSKANAGSNPFESLLEQAASSLPSFEKEMAETFYNGNMLIEKNLAEAAKWFEKAAEGGDSESQFQIARMYLFGEGVNMDIAKALKWYGTATIQYFTTTAEEHSDITDSAKQKVSETIDWLQSNVTRDNFEAQLNTFLQEKDVEALASAKVWLEEAAQQGSDYAQELLNKYFSR